MVMGAILRMTADRELDALVAEHVMGYEMWEGIAFYPKYYVPEYDRTYTRDVPFYSTDIAAAWEVVERMRPRFMVKLTTSVEDKWWVEFKDDVRVYCDTLQEAICKAALLAIGGHCDDK